MIFEPIARNRSAEIMILGPSGENVLVLSFVTDKAVDRKSLVYALDKALARHPLMGAAFVVKDGDMYYAKNDLPVLVTDSKNYPLVGTKETNQHLLYIRYHENNIEFVFHHALTDLVGADIFIKTLFYYYYCKCDNTDYPSDGICIDDGKDHPEGWEDPFGNIYDVNSAEGRNTNEGSSAPGFAMPENNRAEKRYTKYSISLSADSFMKFVKNQHTSPSIAVSLLMMRGIRSLYHEDDKVIKARMPVDIRNRLGFYGTLRNCVVMQPIAYNPVMMDSLIFTEQAQILKTSFAKMIDNDNLKRTANGYMQFMKAIEDMETIEQKKELLSKGRRPDDTAFLVSYARLMQCNGLENRITSFSFNEKEPYTKINVTALGDNFYFEMLQSFEEDSYIKAFGKQLEEFGFNVNIAKEYYELPIADVAGTLFT